MDLCEFKGECTEDIHKESRGERHVLVSVRPEGG